MEIHVSLLYTVVLSPTYRQNPNSYLFVQGNGLGKLSLYWCKELENNYSKNISYILNISSSD